MMTQNRWLPGLAAAMGVTVSAVGLAQQVNVTTWKNDVTRGGANTQETILTTANVNVATFGKLFEAEVDGNLYAQPLVLTGVPIGNGIHNVVYVATEHDTVYAMDAGNGSVYAQVSLIPAGGSTVSSSTDLGQSCGDISPEIGITGTPVIDPSSNTFYVVAKSKINGSIVQYLHALDTTTLAEKTNSPVEITAQVPGAASDSVNGVVTFNPIMENQRPGLLLDQGHVVISWASHCDHGPYHGWAISYNAATLAQDAVWNATPNGQPGGTLSMGGIWMSGAAPAADPNGNIYLATGNGYEDGSTEFGDIVVKLGLPANGTLPVLDYFNPFNENGANTIGDLDLGSGGIALLPTAGTGAQLLAQAGKAGTLHLLDRNNLGMNCLQAPTPCTGSDTQIPQEMPGPLNNGNPGSVFSTPVVWNGTIYWNSAGTAVTAYLLDPNTGLMSSTPVSQTSASLGTFASQDAGSLSANGTTNGIYWFMHNNGTVFAFDATNLGTELWDSGQNGGRDRPGSSTKFAPPTIANGIMYIGVSGDSPPGQLNALVAYGLLNTSVATAPTFYPATGTYAGARTVLITNATPNSTFFYTTDGTTPTTASTVYNMNNPPVVSANETLQAIASANGVGLSAVASATYTINAVSSGTSSTTVAQPSSASVAHTSKQ